MINGLNLSSITELKKQVELCIFITKKAIRHGCFSKPRKLHNDNRTKCEVYPRVSLMDNSANNNDCQPNSNSSEEETAMNKKGLATVFVFALLISVMAGAELVSVGSANPFSFFGSIYHLTSIRKRP